MGKLAKARDLSRGEWLLLLQSSVFLPAVRCGLKLLPFKTVMALFAGKQSLDALDGKRVRSDRIRPDRLAYLVEVASCHHFLKPTCLEKALLLIRILRQRGLEADLRIGTAKTDGRFEAHAWVEHRGQVLLGGPVERYSPLLPLEATRRQSQLA
ncbi:MAG: hypothetical protein A3H28_11795 [Acidobacteria bacterium RIFCSPLOWO2_02_FULL_61_28]|nr:MAG: hypothetical protein A3H28_11795 [Acidobacteria bacterium RIFCSPLOWO2_02_FULL_61_28]OFW30822.1 MAG: hypothetical protein A3J28_04975 [Acidobacteria bacterium RIFCSPLOWO2_12_FULL_60_22]